MAFNITDNDEITIYITDGWREWYIPKFRLIWTVDEPNITLFWTDTEKGVSGKRRNLPLDYTDVTFGYTSPSSAAEIASILENYIISAFTPGALTSVSVDGVTITGDGTPGDPLVGHFAGGANLWAYRAKTTITSGSPTSGHMIWNNATQTSATELHLSHLTEDDFDIDIFFEFLVTGDKLVVQDRNDSDNFQIWVVSGTVTIVPHDYAQVPVTLDSSGGTGTTNFSNNHELLVAKFGALASGFVESVTALSNIPVKVDNSDPVNPVLDFEVETKTETADFTLALDDAWDVINLDTTGLLTVTVPTNASVAFPIGTSITFWGSDTGSVSFAPDTGVTINSLNGYLGLNGQFAKATLTKTGTNEWLLDGDLDVALDPDAHAYIDAVGTFTDAEKGYINTWFTSAKANGYYSKYHAVYLFLGGTAAAHKWNAIDPQDTNGAFRLVFTGSPTHNANGVTFNGTTQYATTYLQPSSVLGQNSKHYSAYLRTAGTGCHFGALNAGFAGDILMTSVGGTMYWCASVGFTTDPPEGTRTQFWSVERSASTTSDVRRNDISVDSDATASTVNVALDIVIGARNSNGTINVFSADNISFFAIGDAFTAGEITSEYADVVQLQTDFARNV